MPKCRRCGQETPSLKATPLGGFIVCPSCVEEVVKAHVEKPIIYFGRCYRDVLRLCSDDCAFIELGPPEKMPGTTIEKRVEWAYCNAQPKTEYTLRDDRVLPCSTPVVLRRRSSDEYLAALLLMTEGVRTVEPSTPETKEEKAEGEEGPRGKGYREGDWE